MENLQNDKVIEMIKKRGAKGFGILEILKSQNKFLEFIGTGAGFELLKDIMARSDELLSKIHLLKATDQEKIEYSVLLSLFERWNKVIVNHENLIKNINAGKI